MQAPTAQPEAPPSAPPPPVDEELLALTDNVSVIRGTCDKRLKFEVEYGMKRGTTDNSYLVRGAGGAFEVLLDVPDESFLEKFVAQLQACGAVSSLKSLVLGHLTPKRMPSLKAVLKVLADRGGDSSLDVYLSNPALQLLRSSFGADDDASSLLSRVTLHVAKNGQALPLSNGDSLSFLLAPTPRWPDLLLTYSTKEKLLFSSKMFSAHVSPDLVEGSKAHSAYDDGGWEVYGADWQFFHECMLAPVARQAVATLERLNISYLPPGSAATLGLKSGWLVEALPGPLRGALSRLAGAAAPEASAAVAAPAEDDAIVVTSIAPLHGPAIKYCAAELLRNYTTWTAEQVAASEECGVLVLYASAYGNTAALAQAISRGITKAGVGVEQLNLELASLKEVEAALARAKGFCIGSPTLGGHMPTQVVTALGSILASTEARELPAGVFGSFGWSGEAVDKMEQKLKDGGFQLGFDSIRCKFKPTAAMIQVCEESGTDLAQTVKRKKARAEKSLQVSGATLNKATAVVGGTGAQQALGRVVGSLTVLSARDGDARSGMLASWISQASFDPPGLTVAVKKDRAVEGLMPIGAPFVLNILAEGKERPILKHMFKVFAPGEDRFEGLAHTESEASGCVVLDDCAAYLECSVVQKMDAGDHWVIYAQVNDGNVKQEQAQSALHHRKIGTSY